MSRLAGLAVATANILKGRYPGVAKFTFTVEVDKEEFKDGAFNQQLLEHLDKHEMAQLIGWKKCEEYILKSLQTNEPIEFNGKNYKLIEIKDADQSETE